MDEPQANTTAIERMESLLQGLKALSQHLNREETDHAKLVTLIIRNELEDLLNVCKVGDTSLSHYPVFGSRDGAYTIRFRLSALPSKEESPSPRPKSDSGESC